jgi:hypothetical protein
MAVEKEYRFEGRDGPAGLLDVFEGARQLIVYRFFFEPAWPAGPNTAAAAAQPHPPLSWGLRPNGITTKHSDGRPPAEAS